MAFTGFSTYDDPNTIQEDIVDRISILVAKKPILRALNPPDYAAKDVIHYWLEDRLSPGSIINSIAVDSATADTNIGINGVGNRLQPGDLLEYLGANSITYREQMQVTSILGANTVRVSRGVGALGPSSTAAGGTITLVSPALLEGGDYDHDDISRARSRQSNTVQIFGKPVNVSDTRRNVSQYGIADELDTQKDRRLEECMRDLEQTLVKGVDSNTIGSDSAYRRMGGLWNKITTNVATFATVTASAIDNLLILPALENDGHDLDAIIVDPRWKIELDTLQDGRVRVDVREDTYGNRVSEYLSGLIDQPLQVISSVHMLRKSMIVTNVSERVKVVNLQGSAFAYEELAKTGRSTKGHISGEYTAEIIQEFASAKAYSS